MQILSLYAGILGLILVYLSNSVVGYRKNLAIGIGDGKNGDLTRAIRVHANFIEYVPVALILLLIFVSNGGDSLVTHILGSVLVIARLLHAYGLGKTIKTSFGRFVGVLLTWLVITALSGFNIYYFFNAPM